MFPARLTAGYRAFLAGRFEVERQRYETLAATGQKPEIMVIGCVDSRVSPEAIFEASPGELLVVRNVGNIAPAYETAGSSQHGVSAALEFGVMALKVKHIVVLGHARCGGVRAFAEDNAPLSASDFIGRWVSQIAPAAAKIGPPQENERDLWLHHLELASVELSLQNLMTFPWIASAVARGALNLHGAYFGVATGHLLVRDPQTKQFDPVF